MNWAWFICRASGIGAWIVFSGVLALGLLTASGVLPRLGIRRQAALRAFHEQLTWSGLGLLVLHVMSLMFDEFLHPRVMDLVWPFRSDLPNRFWVGLGALALAGILLAVVVVVMRKWLGNYWRWAHRLSLLAYGLVVAHVIGTGSDLGSGIGMVVAVQLAVLAVLLLGLRIYGAHLEKTSPPGR